MSDDIAKISATQTQVLALDLGITESAKKTVIQNHLVAMLTMERERCAEYARSHLEDIEGCDMADDEPERIARGILSDEAFVPVDIEFPGGEDE